MAQKKSGRAPARRAGVKPTWRRVKAGVYATDNLYSATKLKSGRWKLTYAGELVSYHRTLRAAKSKVYPHWTTGK